MTAIPLEAFEAERDRLFGVAYRMTGSAADAEDVVQEAWLRAERSAGVVNPAAWLTTVVTRLSLDRLRSATRRRETYVGPWLPEPLVTDRANEVWSTVTPSDPAERVVHDETLTLSFLHVLDRLEPVERAVFLLREVFDAGYEEVSSVVGRSPSTCRQIARRARDRVRAERPRFEVDAERRTELVTGFLDAVFTGDPDPLRVLLAEDVVLVSDGGPTRRAARHPIVGPHRVSRFLTGLVRRHGSTATIELVEVNHTPALAAREADSGELFLVIALEFDGAKLRRIETVSAPDKLAAVRSALAGP